VIRCRKQLLSLNESVAILLSILLCLVDIPVLTPFPLQTLHTRFATVYEFDLPLDENV